MWGDGPLRRPEALGGERARYSMLDAIREYGLREAGGERLLRRRHRDWYAGLAARQEPLGS